MPILEIDYERDIEISFILMDCKSTSYHLAID